MDFSGRWIFVDTSVPNYTSADSTIHTFTHYWGTIKKNITVHALETVEHEMKSRKFPNLHRAFPVLDRLE